MDILKRTHASLLIEEAGERLLIDPGSFEEPLADAHGITAVVITHEHPDHWSAEQLDRVRELSPRARFFGPAGLVAAAADFPVEAVSAGESVSVGAFNLRFFGGSHAVIHPSIPVIDNVGVWVNERLYYPGDSFAVPEGIAVDILAAPAGAPWLKISEAMDFVTAVGPRRVFPTHDAVLSAIGRGFADQRLGEVTRAGGGEYFALIAGDTLSV